MKVYTNHNAIFTLLERYIEIEAHSPWDDIEDILLFDRQLIQPTDAEQYGISVTDLGNLRPEWKEHVLPYIERVVTQWESAHIDCLLCNGLAWYQIYYLPTSQQLRFKRVKPKPKVLRGKDLLYCTQDLDYMLKRALLAMVRPGQLVWDIQDRIKRVAGQDIHMDKPLNFGDAATILADTFIKLLNQSS